MRINRDQHLFSKRHDGPHQRIYGNFEFYCNATNTYHNVTDRTYIGDKFEKQRLSKQSKDNELGLSVFTWEVPLCFELTSREVHIVYKEVVLDYLVDLTTSGYLRLPIRTDFGQSLLGCNKKPRGSHHNQ